MTLKLNRAFIFYLFMIYKIQKTDQDGSYEISIEEFSGEGVITLKHCVNDSENFAFISLSKHEIFKLIGALHEVKKDIERSKI